MYFCKPKNIDTMKTKFSVVLPAMMMVAAMSLTGCVKNYEMRVSSQDMRFGLEAETQTIILHSNCKWTIDKKDAADWYTISPMSGKATDSIITVSVNAYPDGDYRGTSFVINSPGGHVHRTVFVAQSKIDFYSMINKVFGVTRLEHWNTDYYGQIIEDSYKDTMFDPYDTTAGYLMYFLADGQGFQRDRHNDAAVYYAFTYEYNPVDQVLHIEFETVGDEPENYDPTVLTASDSLYRFIHEYKPNFWERADMRKIGIINPDEKSMLMRKATKRTGDGGVFNIQ